MRYFVQFSYLGTNYHGSQTQPNGVTVQETMEQAFSTVLREPVALTFAGRTDAGVHAVKMVAHFDYPSTLNSKLPPQAQLSTTLNSKLSALNSLLPNDIAVERIWEVSEDMHARFSATSRTYEYHITTLKDPFSIGKAARVAPGLDFEAMNKAAQYLLGTHDFASFCKVHTDVKTTICTVSRAHWSTGNWQQAERRRGGEAERQIGGRAERIPTPLLPYPSTPSTPHFTITADRFLRNMVRAVVGTLFEIGRGKRKPEDILDILEQKNRCSAGQSAPAEGLYLVDIVYPE